MIQSSFLFSRVRLPVLLAIFICCFANGCQEPKPTAASVDQTLVGSWVMEKDQTMKEQVEVLKAADILKVYGDVQEFKRNFASAFFTIELLENARFTCVMGSSVERGEFSGYWDTEGDLISLVQTHEGDKKKSDRLEGKIVGEQLHLLHSTEGLKLPCVFDRKVNGE